MKKILAIVLCLAMLCGCLAGCGEGDTAGGDKVIKIGIFEPASGANGAGGKPPDGSPQTLDESSARCFCRFIRELGLGGTSLQVETAAGPILAQQLDRRSFQVCLHPEGPWSQGCTNLVAEGEILDEDLPELYWLLSGALCQE